MNRWHISDDTVGLQTHRKELSVANGVIGIIIEYTGYTGQFTAKGRKLAARVRDLLNAVDRHQALTEARQDDFGWPLRAGELTLKAALAKVRELGFKGHEAQELARNISGRKRRK